MRNRIIAALLAFFLGSFGVHRFYLGRNLSGVLYFLFCWTGIPGVLGIIECILLVLMSEREFDLKYNADRFDALAAQVSYAANQVPRENLEELKLLNELRISGAISDKEYEQKKRQLMS